MGNKPKHVVLAVTGSIAAYKACEVIRRLKEQQARVTVMMTKEAESFITPLTLSALSGEKVFRNLLSEEENSGQMSHIELARQADVILISPATANIIGKIANGLADDVITCTVMASRAPVVIAPAMNDDMFHNPFVQENCQKLKARGVHFVDPVQGQLACGTVGEGHIAEVADIVKKVVDLL